MSDGSPPLGAPGPGDEELIADATATAQKMSGVVAAITFVALHGVAGVLTLTLAGVAPWWAVLTLTVVWVVVARSGWRHRRTAPVATMLAPLAYGTLLVLTLAAGLRWGAWGA